jgi:hypothetical protein
MAWLFGLVRSAEYETRLMHQDFIQQRVECEKALNYLRISEQRLLQPLRDAISKNDKQTIYLLSQQVAANRSEQRDLLARQSKLEIDRCSLSSINAQTISADQYARFAKTLKRIATRTSPEKIHKAVKTMGEASAATTAVARAMNSARDTLSDLYEDGSNEQDNDDGDAPTSALDADAAAIVDSMRESMFPDVPTQPGPPRHPRNPPPLSAGALSRMS